MTNVKINTVPDYIEPLGCWEGKSTESYPTACEGSVVHHYDTGKLYVKSSDGTWVEQPNTKIKSLLGLLIGGKI